MQTIDIVVTTCGRLNYLKRTIDRILEATISPYRMHIIDDGSNNEQKDYIYSLLRDGLIEGSYLRRTRQGAMNSINVGTWLSFSDPVVFTDDDVLCPILPDRDWLERGLDAMCSHWDIGMLCLEHPGAKYKPIKDLGDVVLCKSVGGTFLFTRREFAMQSLYPNKEQQFDRPLEPRCEVARQKEWDIAYLKGVYCYHFGRESTLTSHPYAGKFIPPVDWDTLSPE